MNLEKGVSRKREAVSQSIAISLLTLVSRLRNTNEVKTHPNIGPNFSREHCRVFLMILGEAPDSALHCLSPAGRGEFAGRPEQAFRSIKTRCGGREYWALYRIANVLLSKFHSYHSCGKPFPSDIAHFRNQTAGE